ncbi:MAG: hypothetical protein DSY80_05795 [Desulfocapsa sp.]|nr:MAG: hypothetical protein DSY80_05795 [Desulfocapsa sp.]
MADSRRTQTENTQVSQITLRASKCTFFDAVHLLWCVPPRILSRIRTHHNVLIAQNNTLFCRLTVEYLKGIKYVAPFVQ